MKSTAKKIEFGDKDLLSPDEFADHRVKMRITTMLDLDLLKALKTKAAELKMPYQTLLNEILRKTVIDAPDARSLAETKKALEQLVLNKDILLEMAAERRDKKRA
jgi:hypothetical protein